MQLSSLSPPTAQVRRGAHDLPQRPDAVGQAGPRVETGWEVCDKTWPRAPLLQMARLRVVGGLRPQTSRQASVQGQCTFG